MRRHRTKVFELGVVALGTVLLAVFAVWPTAEAAAAEPPHGYVEPCTVGFIEDGNAKCERCTASDAELERCTDRLANKGYERKCRAHGTRDEVWCISVVKAKAAGKPTRLPYGLLSSAAFGIVAAGVAFLFSKRRGKRRSKE